MQEAGSVLHLARSGRLILRSKITTIREGTVLVDEKGRRSCKVFEIIGQVSNPYISAQPLTDRIERITGMKLYLPDNPSNVSDRTFG
ncbi:MAG: hypothetical protein JRN15_01215, partial [Nitrososphaerota archaeon]|nr:hypothetical protein [Nitrososphaerota archaeon]